MSEIINNGIDAHSIPTPDTNYNVRETFGLDLDMEVPGFSDISEYFNRIFQKIVDVVICKSDFARLIEFSPSISIAASISGVSQCRVRLAARPVRSRRLVQKYQRRRLLATLRCCRVGRSHGITSATDEAAHAEIGRQDVGEVYRRGRWVWQV